MSERETQRMILWREAWMGCIQRGHDFPTAANHADKAVKAFEEYFPVKEEPDVRPAKKGK